MRIPHRNIFHILVSNLILFSYGNKKSKSELAREKLVQVVVAHVPIEGHNFRPKAVRRSHMELILSSAFLISLQVYISLMTRKVIDAIKDPSTLDDKDYYGNKRCFPTAK